MNISIVRYILGQILKVEALLLLIPCIIALIYGEKEGLCFIVVAALSALLGFLFSWKKPKNNVFYLKEGCVTTASSWIMLSLIGCLPFYISKEIPSFTNALFETISGFTTTGATILSDIESMSHCMLFWRSFTHWIGGMGVLVFVMALIPNISDRSIHLLRAEVPGPIVGKVVPRIKDSARILYIIYMVLTLVEIIMLFAGGMSFFDSVVHSFGTAGTGGFGTKADSIGGFSNYSQWVIAIFMMIFGINFNIFYMIISKKIKSAFKSEEFWTYLGIILAATVLIAINIYPSQNGLSDTIRHAFFQVSSIITTTGFATQDFDLWPTLSKTILLLLMFIGACAGSTGGGLKVSRIVMLFKSIKREIKQMIHPRSVSTVKFEAKRLEEKTVSSLGIYLAVYLVCFATFFLLICFQLLHLIHILLQILLRTNHMYNLYLNF